MIGEGLTLERSNSLRWPIYVNNSVDKIKLNYRVRSTPGVDHSHSKLDSSPYVFSFNLLHPNISMHILHTVLLTFPDVLAGEICLTIKNFI